MTKKIIFFLGLSLILLAAGVMAKERPCHDDMLKYCRGTPKGKIPLVRCLYAHQDQISKECKASLDAQQARNQRMLTNCASDKRKFCRGVEPAPGKEPLVDCLKSHHSQLSMACRDALDHQVPENALQN